MSNSFPFPYYKEPPIARDLDHLFSFLSYVLLAVAGWIIFSQAGEGFRPEFFSYAVVLTISSTIASFGALFDRYRFELAMLPIIVSHTFIYALSLLVLPNESQGVFIMAAFGFVLSQRLLHLFMVSNKARQANKLEDKAEQQDGR